RQGHAPRHGANSPENDGNSARNRSTGWGPLIDLLQELVQFFAGARREAGGIVAVPAPSASAGHDGPIPRSRPGSAHQIMREGPGPPQSIPRRDSLLRTYSSSRHARR